MSNVPSKAKLDDYTKKGLLRAGRHDTLPLTIYVYTIFTQFEQLWNNVTRQARGIVFDDSGRLIVRSVPKFFNEDEPYAMFFDVEDAKTEVYDKLDGSLIQVVVDPEYGLIVTSKGSFRSKQAAWAKAIVEEKFNIYEDFVEGRSYIFELIHPDNTEMLVINYQGVKELYLWAVVENATGKEHDIQSPAFAHFTKVPIIKDVEAHLMRDDIEGVVVKHGSHRYKVKTEEYLRLHRIVSDFTEKRVWQSLAAGDSLEFPNMPEEFQRWLDETVADLRGKFNDIMSEAEEEYFELREWSDKEVGMAKEVKHKHLVFAQRARKPIEPMVWKMIEPKGESNNA